MKHLILILIAINLFAEQIITLNKTEYRLNVKRNKAILLDFPFNVENNQILGNKDKIQGGAKGKSLYLSIDDKQAEILIWPKNRDSILLTLKTSRHGDRKFIFKDNSYDINENGSTARAEDIRRANIIDKMSSMKNNKLQGFSTYTTNEVIYLGNAVKVTINFRAKNNRYIAERWIVKNIKNEVLDTRSVSKLYKVSNVKAISFDKNILAPGESTVAYYIFEKSE